MIDQRNNLKRITIKKVLERINVIDMEQTDKNFLIRKAAIEDISRIAEILVFVKRMNYRVIFRNDAVSFGEIQVLPVAEKYSKPEILENIWVYEADGIIKGLIRIIEKEIVELYVEHFFQGQGIGAELIEFAIKDSDAGWAAHLVSAHGKEIAIKIFDVDLHVRNGLGAIDDDDRAMLVGDCSEFFDRCYVTKDVGDQGHRNDLGL